MYYFLVFVLLLAVELTYFRLADRFNIIDKPNERSSHTRVTLRGGGIIFYFGALLYFLTNRFEYPWFVTGLTLITIVSFIDDIHSVSKRARLAIHVAAMLLLFYQWGLLTLPWWYIPIALIFCIGIINAYNFMDGINGITGGYSLVVTGTLLYINEYQVNFIEAQLLWDVGSVSIAFIILFLLGKLVIQTRDLSYIILLVVYGVDSVLTIVHRLLLHENISLPHRKHLYQLMANELRIPHTVVSGFYMLLQSIICIGYIYCEDYGYRYLISMILILSCGYIWFMKKYFRLHSIKQK